MQSETRPGDIVYAVIWIQLCFALIFFILGFLPYSSLLFTIIGFLGIISCVTKTAKIVKCMDRNDIKNAYMFSSDIVNIVIGLACGVVPGVLLILVNNSLAQATGNKAVIEKYYDALRNVSSSKATTILSSSAPREDRETIIKEPLPHEFERRIRLTQELTKYEEYLAKLEEEKEKGRISEGVYKKLKEEYTKKIEGIKKETEASEQ
jgi:ribosomal protein L13